MYTRPRNHSPLHDHHSFLLSPIPSSSVLLFSLFFFLFLFFSVNFFYFFIYRNTRFPMDNTCHLKRKSMFFPVLLLVFFLSPTYIHTVYYIIILYCVCYVLCAYTHFIPVYAFFIYLRTLHVHSLYNKSLNILSPGFYLYILVLVG